MASNSPPVFRVHRSGVALSLRAGGWLMDSLYAFGFVQSPSNSLIYPRLSAKQSVRREYAMFAEAQAAPAWHLHGMQGDVFKLLFQ